MAELDDVRARMAALEEMVRDLGQQLAQAKVGGFRTMRDSRRCPGCGGGSLLHIRNATEMTHSGGTVPLSVHHTKNFWGPKTKGPIEYFVCRGCKLIESHAIDLEGVVPDGDAIVAIEPEGGSPGAGPFR